VPCVTHAQLQIRPWFQIGVEAHVSTREIQLFQAHFEHPASLTHGVGGVGAEVHENLVQVRRIGKNGIRSHVKVPVNLYGLGSVALRNCSTSSIRGVILRG